METKPKVSVIISALNEEGLIESTIQELKKQTCRDFEIILSDGLSKDKTVEIAKKYTSKVISSKDKNLGAARNKGAKLAEGDILVFVDADTRLPENTLELIKSHIDKGHIGGSFAVKYWDADKKSEKISKFFNNFFKTLNVVMPIGYGPCMFFDKAAFEKINGFSEDVVFEDQEIARRALLKLGKNIKFITNHHVYASARRLKEKGFVDYCLTDVKLFFKDVLGKNKNSYHENYGQTIQK